MPKGSCPKCSILLSRLRIHRQANSGVEDIGIQTWCRVCGDPFLLFIPVDYIWATDYCYDLDDDIIEHGGHTETGGWGVHLRLDEVLELVFAGHHSTALWPKPTWYHHTASEEMPITVVSDLDETGEHFGHQL